MSRIVIDCRFGSKAVGLGTYVRGLVPALVQKSEHLFQYFLLVSDSRELWLRPFFSNPSVEIVEVRYPHYSFSEQLFLPLLLSKLRADLFFVPHFNVPLLTRVPCVITIHDMILHRYPNTTSFFRQKMYRILFALATCKARQIITVSDATKKDLLSSFPSTEGKITTIHPGISPLFHPSTCLEITEVLSRYKLQSPYFLYIGNAKQHKNVQLLIDVFLASNLSDHFLVLVTAGPEASQLHLSDRVRCITDVSDEDLPHILSGATAFVTASTMEGFCLPVIEAMACGTPVLAPNIPPFPEVTKGHACLIDPGESAFISGLQRMTTDSRVRIPERLLSAEEFATSYRWEASALHVLDVLSESLG